MLRAFYDSLSHTHIHTHIHTHSIKKKSARDLSTRSHLLLMARESDSRFLIRLCACCVIVCVCVCVHVGFEYGISKFEHAHTPSHTLTPAHPYLTILLCACVCHVCQRFHYHSSLEENLKYKPPIIPCDQVTLYQSPRYLSLLSISTLVDKCTCVCVCVCVLAC